jgi:hypothetical protein
VGIVEKAIERTLARTPRDQLGVSTLLPGADSHGALRREE